MPLPADRGSPWRELCAVVGVEFARAECYGVAWDDPIITSDPVVRYDAAIWEPGLTADPFRTPVIELAAATCVCARWRGPAERMTPVYHYLIYAWSREHGVRVDPNLPPFERFVHDPDPVDHRRTVTAEVYVPLRGGTAQQARGQLT